MWNGVKMYLLPGYLKQNMIEYQKLLYSMMFHVLPSFKFPLVDKCLTKCFNGPLHDVCTTLPLRVQLVAMCIYSNILFFGLILYYYFFTSTLPSFFY